MGFVSLSNCQQSLSKCLSVIIMMSARKQTVKEFVSYESIFVCWHSALVLISATKVRLPCEVNVRGCELLSFPVLCGHIRHIYQYATQQSEQIIFSEQRKTIKSLEDIVKTLTFAASKHLFWLSGKFPRGSKT